MIDRTTKLLLAAIALGVWVVAFKGPVVEANVLRDIESHTSATVTKLADMDNRLMNIESDISQIALK
jgi:hypothetical protein